MPRIIHLLNGSSIPHLFRPQPRLRTQSWLNASPEIKGFAVTTQQVP